MHHGMGKFRVRFLIGDVSLRRQPIPACCDHPRKAGDQVFQSNSDKIEKPQRTGYSLSRGMTIYIEAGPRLRHALEKGFFRRLDRVGGSDMHPHAVQPQAKQPLLLVGAIEHFRQREFARRRVGE